MCILTALFGQFLFCGYEHVRACVCMRICVSVCVCMCVSASKEWLQHQVL